jgi:hypothetical protein
MSTLGYLLAHSRLARRGALVAATALATAQPILAQGHAAATLSVPAAIDPRLVAPAGASSGSTPARTEAPARVVVRLPDSASVVRARTRRSVAFMAGGVAAMVAGALIKGNAGGVLAAGGAFAGFYGLYHYLVRNDAPVASPR